MDVELTYDYGTLEQPWRKFNTLCVEPDSWTKTDPQSCFQFEVGLTSSTIGSSPMLLACKLEGWVKTVVG